MTSNPLLSGLNEQQFQAVTLPSQSALILAGAGSGKTRVLTTRLAWLISTGQVSPHGILAVTFTNKAAKEMLARLTAMLPMNARGLWIGTFHGLCNRMLRAHWKEAGLPQLFQILDSADQLSAIKRMLKALNIDDEKFPARDLMYFINSAKEQGLRPHEVEAFDDFARKRIELYQAYEAQCQREGVVDFAELLLRCHELLQRNEPIRAHYQRRFRHILVNEFQDTNVLQYRWLKLLAGLGTEGQAAVMAVGDDDQSIYRFRGAEVGNMRDFEREFHVNNVIRLEQNYRSHGNILDAANAVIKHNSGRLGKNLWTEAGHGEPLRVYEAFNDIEEARWVVEEIRALIHDGTARDDIALLYRSNAQSRVLEHALFSAGIPYRVYGGLRFFERQEVKHALAYMRLIANPHDDTAFTRVVNFPTRGIGARSLEQLQDAAQAHGSSLYGALNFLTGKAAQSVGAFIKLVDQLRFACEGLKLPEMVEQVLELSGLRAHYLTEKEGQERVANLDEIINAAANFISEEGYAQVAAEDEAAPPDPLSAFLSHASLEAGEHQADAGQAAVQLMTVHSAKGLEFDVVFIGGLEEGLFPHENSVLERDGLEEERRLMYVAITRARKRLYLSFAQSRMLHGQTRYNLRSRFFDEIPAELLKWLTPPASARGYGGFGSSSAAPSAPASSNPRSFGSGRRTTAVNDSGFRVGQQVSHAKFGAGVIVNAEGSGSDARVQVNFGASGVKWLALAVAKLSPA
ncbi:UvrD-helicase domain-containing protein [Methyloversatilis sp.]|uniref:UvrD-helicase domain-containing protein n=1 Tax=Methyloversatilis sp. TaxID=2569862 RepID=UPI003D2B7E6D